jgi:Peptidase propeptide and YPEB domain
MSKKQLLAAILFLSIALPASAALADLGGTTIGLGRGEALQDAQDAEADRRPLERFRAAQLSLTQAIEIAEGLHRGSRAAAAAFELSDSAGYRVITVKNGEAWENLIDANTGRVIGPELASSLYEFGRDERSNIVALRSVAQELSDAVRVAEKAASGKAFGGGLMKQEGKLNFFVVVLSGDSLNEVRLVPPKSGRKGTDLYRLR